MRAVSSRRSSRCARLSSEATSPDSRIEAVVLLELLGELVGQKRCARRRRSAEGGRGWRRRTPSLNPLHDEVEVGVGELVDAESEAVGSARPVPPPCRCVPDSSGDGFPPLSSRSLPAVSALRSRLRPWRRALPSCTTSAFDFGDGLLNVELAGHQPLQPGQCRT